MTNSQVFWATILFIIFSFLNYKVITKWWKLAWEENNLLDIYLVAFSIGVPVLCILIYLLGILFEKIFLFNTWLNNL